MHVERRSSLVPLNLMTKALVAIVLLFALVMPQMALASSGTYTIRYQANGGAGTMKSQKVKVGKKTKLKTVKFKRSGYAFVNWNTKKNGKGKSYKNKASVRNLVKSGERLTLYAQWKATAFTVQFSANGGAGTMPSQSIAVGKRKALTGVAFLRDGFAFAGWATKEDGSGERLADKAVVKDLAKAGKRVTLYAQWKPVHYKVRFSSSGYGDTVGTMATQTLTYNTRANLVANSYVREGYVFVGWNTKADGSGTPYANEASVLNLASTATSITLYAQWRPVDYTVIYNGNPGEEVDLGPTTYLVCFDANGGSGEMARQKFESGIVARLMGNAFTFEGHEFVGWNTKADGTGDAYENRDVIMVGLAEPGSEVTLYAQWKPVTYTIFFDANGGSGEMAQVSRASGRGFRLPACGFARDGYVFAGWNTEADGTGDAYEDREPIFDDLAPAGSSVALYAQWREATQEVPVQPASYTISFDANGGSGEMTQQVVQEGKVYRLNRNAFERKNYVFDGWNTKADGTGESYVDRSVVDVRLLEQGADIVLYAQWKGVTITFVFDPNGGQFADREDGAEPSAPIERTEDSRWCDPPTPIRDGSDGKVFYGWSTSPTVLQDGTGATIYAIDDYSVDGDCQIEGVELGQTVTLYAQWSDPITITYDVNGRTDFMPTYTFPRDDRPGFSLFDDWYVFNPYVPLDFGGGDYWWSTTPAGDPVDTSADMTLGELFPDATSGQATLYLVYECEISFASSNGDSPLETMTVRQNEPIEIPTGEAAGGVDHWLVERAGDIWYYDVEQMPSLEEERGTFLSLFGVKPDNVRLRQTTLHAVYGENPEP